MANYLSNQPSFIPTNLWQPDWSTIQQTLAIKQQKYNQGYDQILNMENSLFNSKLTNNQNIEDRERYKQTANKQLQNLSDADLSLTNNVNTAKSVFDPFLQDKAMQMDMVVTKKADQEINTALSLRDSTDPKKRDEYWDLGVQYIQNGLDNLRNADKNDVRAYNQVQNRRYIPAFNANKFLEDQAKASGLKISWDANHNGYTLTTVNGEKATDQFSD